MGDLVPCFGGKVYVSIVAVQEDYHFDINLFPTCEYTYTLRSQVAHLREYTGKIHIISRKCAKIPIISRILRNL